MNEESKRREFRSYRLKNSRGREGLGQDAKQTLGLADSGVDK
jgi:hypothetical protein